MFDALAAPRTLAELAVTIAVRPRRLRALVDLLVGVGRLQRDGEQLACGAAGPTTARGAALLAQVIREDRAFDPARDASLVPDARAFDVRRLLAVGATERAIAAIEDLAACTVFLDAGGGLGDATRSFLARTRGHAILVDLPAVVDAARRHLAPLTDRITFVSADLRTAELPRADLVYVSNVLHLHRATDASAIVATAVRAARQRVVVREVALDDDRRGPARALAFALATVIFGEGEVATATDLQHLMEIHGLTRVRSRRLAAAEWVLAEGRIS